MDSGVLTTTTPPGTRSFIVIIIIALAAQTDLSYELSQSGVAEQQPASGGDAVGFVLKLLRF